MKGIVASIVCLLAVAAAGAQSTPKAQSGNQGGNPRVLLETSKGKIVLELNAAKAPKTVKNFVDYVKAGHYNGTIFHRVIPGFMIQGGGFTAEMQQKPTRSPIQNEADNGLANSRGTIAMARTGDPHSATGQFFINLVDNRALNHTAKTQAGWGYTVFGKVVEGMDVADKIAAVRTGSRSGYQDVPVEPVVITSAKVVEEKP